MRGRPIATRKRPPPSPTLFDAVDATDPGAPLAARMRPQSFDEFVGQEHLVGPDRPLRRAIEADHLPSLILWGPPGSGKTTLARIIAKRSNAYFAPLSAVSAGVAELRQIVADARTRQQQQGQRTTLFIDEIHRFNKAQQDVILPHVEDGTVTLIGATTENPSFEVIGPLLSRARVYTLKPLEAALLRGLLERALHDDKRGLGAHTVTVASDALDAMVAQSDGDARRALSALEASVHAAPADGAVTVPLVEQVVQRRLAHDKAGDSHYDIVSALIKSLRGSDPDASLYWLARMLEAGEDPLFIVRRLVILAAEDIGLADPRALSVAVAAQQAVHFVGMPEGFLLLAEATLYLALAPKSNSALTAYNRALADVHEHGALPVPLHLRNAPTGLMRELGYGAGYQYAHDYEDHVAPDQTHLPEPLAGRRYYEAAATGEESRIGQGSPAAAPDPPAQEHPQRPQPPPARDRRPRPPDARTPDA